MTPSNVRSLFKADAVFEATLGVLLVVGGGSSWLTRGDLPVSRGLLIAAGAGFLVASVTMLLYVARAPRRVLLELAVGNAAMAFAGVVWLIAAHGFSATGGAILAVAITWKFVISGLQLRSMRNTKPAPAEAT
jgi:hypothetical protein